MGSAAIRLALVGVGRIARDQHLPALARSSAFELVAAVDRDRALTDIATFTDIASMLASGVKVDAVSVCTPPAVHYQLAREAMEAGLHVMLEKPPATSVAEVIDLAERAQQRALTLFTAWHSREAAGVEPAREWLSERVIQRVHVTWKEDIRVWHPDQHWLLQAGGLGVFDAGINALSILTRILPGKVTMRSATLQFPCNWESPISAEIAMSHDSARVDASFSFLCSGTPCWDIEVLTDRETLMLADGGSRLYIDETPHMAAADQEYERLYQRFSQLIAAGQSDVDSTPLQLVADAFKLGHRQQSAAFHF